MDNSQKPYYDTKGNVFMTGTDLQHLREAHGLTRRALGELLGYTGYYIYKLEASARLTTGPRVTQRLEKQLDRLFPGWKSKKKDENIRIPLA